MVEDVISNSSDQPSIKISPDLLEVMNDLKEWLFENVYLYYPLKYPDILKAQALVKDLFSHFVLPGNLPDGYVGVQGAVDYIAGMTDQFAISTFAEIKLPAAWGLTK